MKELTAVQTTIYLEKLEVELTYYPEVPYNQLSDYLKTLHTNQSEVADFFQGQIGTIEMLVESLREEVRSELAQICLIPRQYPSKESLKKELEANQERYEGIGKEVKEDKSNLPIYRETLEFFDSAQLRLDKLKEKGIPNSQNVNWNLCYNSFNCMAGRLKDTINLVEELVDLGEKMQRIDALSLLY